MKKICNVVNEWGIALSALFASPDRLVPSLLLASVVGLAANAAWAQVRIPDTLAQRTVACMACHGKEGKATSEGYYPRIAGKPAGYLYNQLINFREGRRRYPLMIYMVDHLSDAYLHDIADYYASLHPPYPPPEVVNVSPATLERGRRLATLGDPVKNVPACIACHGKTLTGVAPFIPGLLGLPRDYLNAQFGAWKNDTRRAAAPDCMAHIAQRLSVEDISAVSAWLASQPMPNDTLPMAATAADKRPMPCGSAPQ
jgi:cytochrome c553